MIAARVHLPLVPASRDEHFNCEHLRASIRGATCLDRQRDIASPISNRFATAETIASGVSRTNAKRPLATRAVASRATHPFAGCYGCSQGQRVSLVLGPSPRRGSRKLASAYEATGASR